MNIDLSAAALRSSVPFQSAPAETSREQRPAQREPAARPTPPLAVRVRRSFASRRTHLPAQAARSWSRPTTGRPGPARG